MSYKTTEIISFLPVLNSKFAFLGLKYHSVSCLQQIYIRDTKDKKILLEPIDIIGYFCSH